MRIPDDKIDEIRSASDIVDVISAHVPLKKRGKSYVGLCPFHQEKTPSFTVSPEKQMYHCFGCGAGGNVFTFVMELEKVSFVEAVRTLAERAGISLPSERPEDRAEATEQEALYGACRRAARFFHENLTSTVEGQLGLEYLHHRGLSDETIRRFGLGYSMNAWDGLVREIEREGGDLAVMERAGLVIHREDATGWYDRFRGRVMFPILLQSGRPIAFGARKLREDDPMGKYINSPETAIYNKSRVLFGLSHARDAIREQEKALLVEGYLDLISLHQAGFQNVVASSGTALTEEQVQLIGRYAPTVVLVYDADSAGSRAALRGVDLVLEQGLDVMVAELPAGEDPDTFVRKHGEGSFRELLARSVTFLDFKAGLFAREGTLATPEGKTRAVRSIVESIARMKDELKRNFYVKSVAEKYDIYESVLFRELEAILARDRRRVTEASPGAQAAPVRPTSAPQQAVVRAEEAVPSAERELVRLLLEHGGDVGEYIFSEIDPEIVSHPRARGLVELVRKELEAGRVWDVHAVLDRIEDDATRRFVADLLFAPYELSRGWMEHGVELRPASPGDFARDVVLALRLRQLDAAIAAEFQRLKAAESRGEPLRTHKEEIVRLQQERKSLLARKNTRDIAPSG